ncbi:MAG: hypothetical protein GEU93_08390 [Propionibacteriales bacterium]|nr:hypothetical protein [Propionibacteriales bacterium]
MRSSVAPKGPLPSRVYWRRRVVLLAVVALVLYGVGQLVVGGGGDAESASSDAGSSTPAASDNAGSRGDDAEDARSSKRSGAGKRGSEQQGRGRTKTSKTVSTSLDAPSGSCEPGDVVVKPDVVDAPADAPVPLRIGVSTIGAPCTFQFSPETVVLQITSGDDMIWQSKPCASSIPSESVVVRPGWLTYVEIDWNGRRGTENCSDGNEYASPGYYWAEGAAIGGEAARGQFELDTPPPPEKKERKKSDGKQSEDSEQTDGEQSEAGQSDGEQTGEGGADGGQPDAGPTDDDQT